MNHDYTSFGATRRAGARRWSRALSEAICTNLRITGRVQGVGFRWSLCAEAQALGLAGWVRNRRDGSVEALLYGPPAAVDRLRQWAQRGPPMARVDRVVSNDGNVAEIRSPDRFEQAATW